MIMASIARLGFAITDVGVLRNSEPHFDHAGGPAALRKASGAVLWVSEAGAVTMAGGGYDRDAPLPTRALAWTLAKVGRRCPAPRVDRRLGDGDTIRVGPLAVTAHVTGGRTRGCTSYALRVSDGNRALQVVSACSVVMLRGTG